MQIVFQDPLAALDPRMTGGRDHRRAAAHLPARALPPAEAKAKVQAMMAKVGLLPQQINRYPHEFSGGQCQRIGIARAMILKPKLVVCDEPVSALDVSIQAQIVNLLMDLQREFGMSMIFISHNLSVVRHISHRIMVLYLGRVMELADRDQLYRKPRHPYTQALISAVPIPDPDLERQQAAHRADGRPALAAQSAQRLRLPHPLPQGDGDLRPRAPGPAGHRSRATRSPAITGMSE